MKSNLLVHVCTLSGMGTTYLSDTLRRHGIENQPVHSHQDLERKPIRAKTFRDMRELGPVIFISTVRDTLSTIISQTFWRYSNERLAKNLPWFDQVKPLSEHTMEWLEIFNGVLYNNFLNDGGFESYFQREFMENFNFDVFATPFSPENGYAVLSPCSVKSELGRIDDKLILLRTDRIESALRVALSEAHGEDVGEISFPNELRSARDTSMKGAYNNDKEYYKYFVGQLSLSDSDIDGIYDRKYSRHFFAESEIDTWKKHWKSVTR